MQLFGSAYELDLVNDRQLLTNGLHTRVLHPLLHELLPPFRAKVPLPLPVSGWAEKHHEQSRMVQGVQRIWSAGEF